MTPVGPHEVALLTDLYELTMASSYLANGMNGVATFDLFVRELPRERRFLVVSGLESALDYLEHLRFETDDISYLRDLGLFTDDFLGYLSELRFTGEVRAIPEGEIAFAGEPLLQVTAPLIQAQIVETFLLNCITFQTMVASKAARVNLACRDRSFVDFSLRRDHGADAGLFAARASYIGGAVSTSNVLAGKRFGIPVSGTMAHSYVMAFDDEISAFRAYARDFGSDTVLLIDTFDVERGTLNAIGVAREAAARGVRLKGVRIDSGDLGALAGKTRRMLDDADLHHMEILLSGDLDEYRIDQLIQYGAPADSFGVGTQLGTSGDAPSLGGAYKLVQDERGPRIKLSTGKATLPGRKQVYRYGDGDDSYDLIALESEDAKGGRPLLETVMTHGKIVSSQGLDAARQRLGDALPRLPRHVRSLEPAPPTGSVSLSSGLLALVDRMQRDPGG